MRQSCGDDFTVHDSARPCRIVCPEPFGLLILKIPRDVFASHCPLPPGSTAVPVSGERGVGALFSALLGSLPAHINGLPPDVAGQVGVNVLELLATATSDLAGGSRPALPRQAQLLRARRYITDHLGDPELSPPTVAEALGSRSATSTRSSDRELLAAGSRSVIEPPLACSPTRQVSRSITDIAFCVCFKATAHFSRAFKYLHGISPREYRERCADVSLS